MEEYCIVVLIFMLNVTYSSTVYAECNASDEISVEIESGWLCGKRRAAENNVIYASFRNVPYAEQPTGQYRFRELRKKKNWPGYWNAREDGPICPQNDEDYGLLVYPNRTMSEECIHANIHVPLTDGSLPTSDFGLPILVFVHGGSFQVGSGDADLQGPEDLVSKGVIVNTFNYRINVFGILSLDSADIPGNNGLRDVFTLLNWVQVNARAVGGDPSNVTLMGQSAGATVAHLVSLVHDCETLFKRVVIMSGTGMPDFYSASKTYAKHISGLLVKTLGLNSTDPTYVYEKLITMSVDKIISAVTRLQQSTYGLPFVPCVESLHPGVKRMLEEDPLHMAEKGRGSKCPLIIGFTSAEREVFRPSKKKLNELENVKNPLVLLSPHYAYELPKDVALELASEVEHRYFNGNATLDGILNIFQDTSFVYSAFRVARLRAFAGVAPAFLYCFSYQSEYNFVRLALGLERFKGATHIEDLTFIFRENVWLGDHQSFPPTTGDDCMKDTMTDYIVNFINCNDPTCSSGTLWKPVSNETLYYQLIAAPNVYNNTEPTQEQLDMIAFFDSLEEKWKEAMTADNEDDICY